MKVKKSVMKYGIIIAAVLVVVSLFAIPMMSSGKYDEFAACLTDNQVTFFGAFWCPHCAAQKKMFGKSMKNINYVECSTPDRRGQTQICIDEEIKNYPTWEFADGTRETGVVSLERLAVKSGCSLN